MNWAEWILEKMASSIYDYFFNRDKTKKVNSDETKQQQSKHSPIIDVIKNEEELIIVKSKAQDFNTKSVLIVMPGEKAVFINNGRIIGVLGEGRHILNTQNYSFLSDAITLITGTDRIYSSNIYFVRTAVSSPIDWGTSLQLRDPIQLISTRLMCNGTYRICIVDSERILKYFLGNGFNKINSNDLANMLKGEIIQKIKSYLTDYIITRGEEILGISCKQSELSEKLEKEISDSFIQYGIRIVSFSISRMEILDDGSNRKEIEEAYKDKRIKEIIG